MNKLDNRQIYGAVPERIQSLAANALNEEVQPVKKKSFTVILLTAILILALTCTALAMGLTYSARSNAVNVARETLAEAYGFTNTSLGMFIQSAEQDAKGWHVTFTPTGYGKRLGSYTVTLPNEGAPEASWTYDGTDLAALQDAGLDSDVWGAWQVELALETDEAYLAKLMALQDEKGDMRNWTLAERAELQAMFPDAAQARQSMSIDVMPGPNDLQEADAIAVAREVVMASYGLTQAELDGYATYVSFIENTQNQLRQYYVTLSKTEDTAEASVDDFYLTISSPSGTATQVFWVGLPENAHLPEGPLDNYPTAVISFMNSGAFDQLPLEEKAAFAKRLEDAGLQGALRGVSYAAPDADSLTLEEAEAAFAQAVQEHYGLTPDMVALFHMDSSFQTIDGRPAWVFELNLTGKAFRSPEYFDKLGEYRVCIDAETGEMLDASWTLEKAAVDNSQFGEHNWAKAPAWNAEILSYTMPFQKELNAFLAENDNQMTWEAERLATLHAMMRGAGFDEGMFNVVMPDPSHLTEAEAYAIAIEALSQAFHQTPAYLKDYPCVAKHEMTEEGIPVWHFELYGENPGKEDIYRAVIAAEDGEIIQTTYIAKQNG